MKRNRVSITERKGTGLKQNQTITQKKPTSIDPRVMRKNTSGNMVSTRSKKEQKAKKTIEEQSIPAKETELETPDQIIKGIEHRETETTPMPNIEEQGKNTIEFSPIGNGVEVTNTPETIENDSQTKRTSFTERIAAMVGDRESKTFGTVTTITPETRKDREEATQESTASQDKLSKAGRLNDKVN